MEETLEVRVYIFLVIYIFLYNGFQTFRKKRQLVVSRFVVN